VQLGTLDEALDAIDAALVLRSKATWWIQRSYILDRLGDRQAALQSSKQATLADPSSSSAWATAAFYALAIGQIDNARAYADRAYELDNESSAALEMLAKLAIEVQDLAQARDLAERAVRANPTSITALSTLASIESQDGRRDEAIDHIQSALRLEPDSAFLHEWRGSLLLYDFADPEASLPDFEQAVRLDPTRASAFLYRARARALLNHDCSDALPDFAQSAELEPTETVLAEWALCQARSDPSRALEIIDRAASEFPASSYVYTVRGHSILLPLHRNTDAISDIRRAQRLDPSYAWAHYAEGLYLLYQANDPVGAVRKLEDAIERGVQEPDRNLQLGWAQHRAGLTEDALLTLTQETENRPTADGFQYLGLVHAQMEDWRSSLSAFNDGLELDARNAPLLTYRGFYPLDELGRYPEALSSIREAQSVAPDWATPYYHEAWIRANRLGAGRRSIVLLDRYLELGGEQSQSYWCTRQTALTNLADPLLAGDLSEARAECASG